MDRYNKSILVISIIIGLAFVFFLIVVVLSIGTPSANVDIVSFVPFVPVFGAAWVPIWMAMVKKMKEREEQENNT